VLWVRRRTMGRVRIAQYVKMRASMMARVASQSRAEPGGRMWLSEGLTLVIYKRSADKW
jgi:hypothetical protein